MASAPKVDNEVFLAPQDVRLWLAMLRAILGQCIIFLEFKQFRGPST